MKPQYLFAAIITAAALAAVQPAVAAADAHAKPAVVGAAPAAADTHAHAADAPVKLTLDHGKRWTTDAPLRLRMNEIRALVAPKLGAVHAGTLPPTDYAKLGADVEGKVAAIVSECKLPPAADAMLHLIVADLVAGADVMQGKAPGDAAEGAHRVVTAANAYGRYFDHPGWKPLR